MLGSRRPDIPILVVQSGQSGGSLNAIPGLDFTKYPQIMAAPPVPTDYRTKIVQGDRFIETLCASGSNPVATPTVVTRTSVQHAVGGYHQALPHTADLESRCVRMLADLWHA